VETSEQQRRPTIGQSAQKLRQWGLDFDAVDLADMFWLAQFIELDRTERLEDETQRAKPGNSVGTVEGAAVSSGEAAVNIYIDDRHETSPDDSSSTEKPKPPPGLPFPVPAAPALRVRLDLARALRPLMRKVPSQTRYELDEDATVTRIAETQMIIPIVRSRPERWLDLDLVVEDSKTTVIWERTIAELQHLLEYQGAFRTVRTWRLAVAHPQTAKSADVQLFPRWRGLSADYLSQRPRGPRELLDPGSRRLILVVSDCTSALWQRGIIHEILWQWAESQPLSIVQLFPERLWTRTALNHGHRVRLGATAPGLPSARLDVSGLPALDSWDEFDDLDKEVLPDSQARPDEQRCLVLPIVTLDPKAMYRWARVIAGGGDTLTPGRVFELKVMRQMATNFATSGSAAHGAERTARQRVALFKATASQPALALAKYMAATPVSLPVIDLLRDEFVHEARQEHVAEVLLSGLLQRVDPAEGDERCQYEFFVDRENTKTTERVRDLLVDDVPIAQTRSVMDRLSQLIKDKAGNTLKSFEAFLTAFDESGIALGEGALPLATVGLEVLQRLGGSHAALAMQYERILQTPEQNQPTQPTDNNFPLENLEDLEYEVAKLLNFPPLQPCDYESATITAILDRFDFETATLEQTNADSDITAVDWTGNNRRKFRLALQESYPTYSALSIFVREELNITLTEITRSTSIVATIANLLKWAESQGRLDEIFEAFCHDRPNHSFVRELQQNSSTRSDRAQEELRWRIDRSRGTTWGYTEPLSTEPSAAINLDMIFIPSGSFTMGAPPSEPESRDRERPQHEVTLPPFYLGRYAVTQAQWRVVAGYPRIDRDLDPDPSNFKGDHRPVDRVSWDDVQEFCQRLSAQTGKSYCLPSEAQWEYGCRAGTTTPFHFGETITPELVNYDGTETYNDSPKGEYRQETTDVGSFPANDWGLHDMHGNVWEWCEDDWHGSYEGAPIDGSAWVESDRTETRRLLRGGAWVDAPGYCRSADRYYDTRDYRFYNFSFRVCCVPPRLSS
jgi:formylglycine-generating enzyme required for sulfatase activity